MGRSWRRSPARSSSPTGPSRTGRCRAGERTSTSSRRSPTASRAKPAAGPGAARTGLGLKPDGSGTHEGTTVGPPARGRLAVAAQPWPRAVPASPSAPPAAGGGRLRVRSAPDATLQSTASARWLLYRRRERA